MRSSILFAILAASLLIAGCDGVPEPIRVEPDGEPVFSRGVAATATGGGVFDAGIPVDFHGEVIWMTSDPAHRRAWIGGVIAANRSEHPAFTRDLHQAGRDIRFRAVDYVQGSSASQPDRTTFVGFEGGGGIATSLAPSQLGTMERGPPEERRRRNRPGVAPVSALNTLVRCASSANPARNATLEMGSSLWAKAWAAYHTRSLRMYVPSGIR